jgi:uncharacterized protein
MSLAGTRMRPTHIPAWIAPSFLLVAFLASHNVFGAIRCEGSLSRAEKLICNSESLLTLDLTLNEAYLSTAAVVADKAAFREAQKIWLRTERDTCEDSLCIGRAIRNRVLDLSSARMAAQPALQTPLDLDAARAACTALASHVTNGKLDAFAIPPDPGIVNASPNERLDEGYSVSLKTGQPAVQYGKRETGGSCGSDEIFAITASAAQQPPNYGDDVEGIGLGTRDTLIFFDQRYYVIRSDGKALLVKQISLEGGLQPLCTLRPSSTKMIVVHAEGPAICAARAGGTLRSAKWRPFAVPGTLMYSKDFVAHAGVIGLVSAEVTEADLAGDGRNQKLVRLHYGSGAGCGHDSTMLLVITRDESAISRSAVAERLAEINPADPDVFVSGTHAYIGGTTGESPPGLVNLASVPPRHVCSFMSQTAYGVTELFPPVSAAEGTAP